MGGSLDGLLLDNTGWTPQEVATGAALMTELGQFDADGRALCWSRPEGTGPAGRGGRCP